MLKTNRFESFCRHPEKLFCIKDVGCVMGEVNGYFPKTSGLVKTRAISMSKAASLFKWPFVTRLLGLGLMTPKSMVTAVGRTDPVRREFHRHRGAGLVARPPAVRSRTPLLYL